jgi:hypothetical protein
MINVYPALDQAKKPLLCGLIGHIGIGNQAIGTFAQLNADQAQKDYKMFPNAIDSGEIKANEEK